MKHCIIAAFIMLKAVAALFLHLIDGKYITVKVGPSQLTMAIDPTSNINFIFHSSLFQYANYNATASSTLTVSKAVMKMSYLLGEFKGNLASDLFLLDYTDEAYAIRQFEARMHFILVKEAKELVVPKVDGIFGLGYKNQQSLFFDMMSLLFFLKEAGVIRKKAIHFNYLKNRLYIEKGDFKVKNETIVHMTRSSNDSLPIMYYDNVKLAFSQGKSANFEIEKKMKLNASLIVDTYEDVNEEDSQSNRQIHPSCIIAPKTNKKEVCDYYLSKFQRTQQLDHFIEQRQARYAYYSNEKFANLNLEARSALIFGKFYFVYNWLDNSNLNHIKFPVALGNSTLLYNINLKAFNPDLVTYDYDNLHVKIANCNFCGVTQREPTFVYIILIFVIVLIGSLLVCVAFTKFVRYRKDRASQMLKQFNLI